MELTSFKDVTNEKIIKHFRYTIAERGKYYFDRGYVKNVNILSNNNVVAIVKGNRNYSVNIEINNNKLETSCTCECDFPCKHAAAVLYYLLNNYNTLYSEKSPMLIKLIKAMNGILIINEDNTILFENATKQLVKEILNNKDESLKLDYLMQLFKALNAFSYKNDTHASLYVLSAFEHVDYNGDAFYQFVMQLKENHNFNLLREIIQYIDYEKVNERLFSFLANCAFVIESYYADVSASKAIGVYNMDLQNVSLDKIKRNKYKVGRYAKYLYETKNYNSLQAIVSNQNDLVFDSLFYYIKSQSISDNKAQMNELILLIVTDKDLHKMYSLKDEFTDITYLYFFNNYYNKEKIWDFFHQENKVSLILNNCENFHAVDCLYDVLKEEYNNDLLFIYQSEILNQLANHYSYNQDYCKKLIIKLHNLRNGKYILYFMYRSMEKHFFYYNYEGIRFFKSYLNNNYILPVVQ